MSPAPTVLRLRRRSLTTATLIGVLGVLLWGLWTAPAAPAPPDDPLPAQVAAARQGMPVAEEGRPPFRSGSPARHRDPDALPAAPDEPARGTAEGSSWWMRAMENLATAVVVLLFMGVLFGIPTCVAAVTAALNDGALRAGLSVVGGVLALICGAFTGLLSITLQKMVLSIEDPTSLLFRSVVGGALVFVLGYTAIRAWIRWWLRTLPREEAVAWRRTLTGAALVGAGVGSVATLLRSVFTVKGGGFGGFGGGSFGGGGASGSWSGASGAASSGSAAPAADAAASRPEPPASGLWGRAKQWAARLHWYHVVVFGLITLVFYQLTSATMGRFPFWGAVVPVAFIVGHGLWRWGASAVSSLQGDRYRSESASGSWS